MNSDIYKSKFIDTFIDIKKQAIAKNIKQIKEIISREKTRTYAFLKNNPLAYAKCEYIQNRDEFLSEGFVCSDVDIAGGYYVSIPDTDI